MKHCIFLILLMATPGFAFANDAATSTERSLGKAAPMHASLEPVIMVRQPNGTPPPPKRRIASVKSQPMVIKLKPQKDFAPTSRTTSRPTMAMRPIYPPRRVVTVTPTRTVVRTPIKKSFRAPVRTVARNQIRTPHRAVGSTSPKYMAKQRVPANSISKQNAQFKTEPIRKYKPKLAKAD